MKIALFGRIFLISALYAASVFVAMFPFGAEANESVELQERNKMIEYSDSIYMRNNCGDCEKTSIEIPQHEGYMIAVYKDQHRLYLYNDNEIIKTYDVNVRRDLEDRKLFVDSQTPEGVFYIESMDNIGSHAWSRWMRLNTSDKARQDYIDAFGDANIRTFEENYGQLYNDQSIRNFNAIYAHQKMLRGVGIHGGGFYKNNDWTIGCVALSNSDVNELFEILLTGENGGIGTPVIIQD